MYSYLERTKDYLASFTVAQKALLLGDRALQATSDAVKYTGLGNKVEVKSALEMVDALRRSARAARRAGEGLVLYLLASALRGLIKSYLRGACG